MIRLLPHDQNIPRETDGAVKMKILLKISTKRKGRNSMVVRNGQKIGYPFWQKEEKPRKGFNLPNISCISKQLRHSGGTLVDPALQDNVLLPDDVTEYIYHIGNASEMHSIIRG